MQIIQLCKCTNKVRQASIYINNLFVILNFNSIFMQVTDLVCSHTGIQFTTICNTDYFVVYYNLYGYLKTFLSHNYTLRVPWGVSKI